MIAKTPEEKAKAAATRAQRKADRARVASAQESLKVDGVVAILKMRPHPRAWFAQRRRTAYDFVNWAFGQATKLEWKVEAAQVVERAVAQFILGNRGT